MKQVEKRLSCLIIFNNAHLSKPFPLLTTTLKRPVNPAGRSHRRSYHSNYGRYNKSMSYFCLDLQWCYQLEKSDYELEIKTYGIYGETSVNPLGQP